MRKDTDNPIKIKQTSCGLRHKGGANLDCYI